ncbi:MAG: hypothetical protein LBR68_01220 [Lachnoclostridium sp.]|jgi:predicted nucleic acid-binding protein|nr:hypothetical protein [Lachnoclostridium sp.]
MRKTVIVNSTPIIALRCINNLYILKELYGEIIIPNAVYEEVTSKDSQALTGYNWICVKSIVNNIAKEMFVSALHDGEVEVMLLAKEMDAIIYQGAIGNFFSCYGENSKRNCRIITAVWCGAMKKAYKEHPCF